MGMKKPPRLYVDNPLVAGGFVVLNQAQAHYLGTVMRQKAGDSATLFNGKDGEVRAVITQIAKKTAQLEIISVLRPQQASPDVWLLFAPIKRTPIDYIAQKATELGVSALVPVITQRTIVNKVNLERLNANIIEAAEQTERLDIPAVYHPKPLLDVLKTLPVNRQLLLCDESGRSPAIAKALAAQRPGNHWAIVIGPEGGFTDAELQFMKNMPQTVPVSLGARILRADTAALAALACWQAWLGDW